jgi:iron complex transport system permease protein
LAVVGAILTSFLVYGIAKVGTRLPTASLLLTGIAVGLFFSAADTGIMVFNRDKIDKIVMWSMGSVSSAGWSHVVVSAVCIIPMSVLIFANLRELNAISLGDETAGSLGVDVERTKKALLFASSAIVGICVAVSGVIGFVGLIVPHAARLVTKADHRVLIPVSYIYGAIFLVFCDTIARSVIPLTVGHPAEIPIGAVTALIGAPLFIGLLLRSKKRIIL